MGISQRSQYKGRNRERDSFVFLLSSGYGILDWACMFIFADLCGFNDVLIKCAANVLVIILNYVASKLVIFRHKG